MHHTAVPGDASTLQVPSFRRHHVEVNGWSDIGYHFVVEEVGPGYELVAGRRLDREGAHCPGKNRTHLGVALAANLDEAPPPDGMLEFAADRSAGLCVVFDFGPTDIVTHQMFRATDCPGEHFQLDRFREMVKERM